MIELRFVADRRQPSSGQHYFAAFWRQI